MRSNTGKNPPPNPLPEYTAGEKRAFTLVEVLVVIGIIAVLVGLLLPVVGKAKESANFAACRSNLHQIALAMRMYANDHDDYYPNTDELGRWNYRRGPGEVNPADPFSVPERFGLPAMLRDRGYIKNGLKVWIDPSASELRKSYKNTYAHAIPSNTQRFGTYKNTKSRGKNSSAWWVYCNFQYHPMRTGAMADSNLTRGLVITEDTELIPVHSYRLRAKEGNHRKGAINVMFVDGVVGTVVFNLGGNQSGTIIRGE